MNEPLILVVLISYCNVSFAGFPDLEENSAMLQVFVWQIDWLLTVVYLGRWKFPLVYNLWLELSAWV
jgi:hypothetical protein